MLLSAPAPSSPGAATSAKFPYHLVLLFRGVSGRGGFWVLVVVGGCEAEAASGWVLLLQDKWQFCGR